jgi:calcineurin-like phosphoesterase family protein
MSKVYVVSDLHFGHKNIHKFREEFKDEEEHRETIINLWNKVVTKRDKVFVLGDACFTMEALPSIGKLNGRKVLIAGNHDNLNTQAYLKYFESVKAIVRYKKCWLTHVPIHPAELRGLYNIHGHVHKDSIDDPRYYNVCLENVAYSPEYFSYVKKLLELKNE